MGKSQKLEDKIKMAQPFDKLDDGTQVNAASLKKVVDASGVKVASYWPMLFAQGLGGKDIGSFLSVSSGSGPAQQSSSGGAGAKEEAKKEEAPVEEEEEDMDIGDLFG